MSFLPSDFKFSLAVGVAGAYVEVTSDVKWDNSITRTWGTQNQFIAPSPGVWQFTLDNTTGKYSPDNPASSLATSLGEGTGACWSLNGVLRSGQVRAVQPVFTDIGVPEASARMRVTVTDMLGIAALNTLGNLGYSQVMGSSPYLFWPLNDPVGSGQAAEATGNGTPMNLGTGVPIVFGVAGAPALSDTQLTIGPGSGALGSGTVTGFFPAIYTGPNFVLPANSLGFIGVTNAPVAPGNDQVSISAMNGGISNFFTLRLNFTPSGVSATVIAGGAGNATTSTIPFPPSAQLAMGVTYSGTAPFITYTVTLYINGVSAATATVLVAAAITTAQGVQGGIAVSAGTETFSHFWYGPTLIHEEYAGITTLANRLTAIDQTTQLITLGALPTDFSTAPVGVAATSGQSAFDAIVVAMSTEQGYADTTTTGTLLAPVQTIRTRARQRPVTPAATFGVAVDLTGAPEFARSLNDEISLEKVSGANNTTSTYINSSLIPRVGSANGSDTVLTFQPSDLLEWASDRVWRGIKRTIDITSISLDACGGSGSSLWNALTGLAPGDRISLTGFPSAQLGYSTWDGFLIGAEETHISQVQSIFKLFLAPCPPLTAIIDTDYIGNGTNAAISTLLTSGSASMVVTAADGVTSFEATTLNYYLLVESEQVKVTAVSALVAGVQTLTIVRAQNGTTAAAHAVGVMPEVIASPADVLTNILIAF